MDNKYKVLIKTDVEGHITEVQSSGFCPEEGYIVIDEGVGDRYYHAQNHYFTKPLVDASGLFNYKYVDGVVVERTAEDKAPEMTAITNAARIAELKGYLTDTDYISAKIAEGAATITEYADEIAQRAAWRAEINTLGG